MRVRGFGLGGFEVLGFGWFVVFEVQDFVVWGFGHVVSRFDVLKVRGFRYRVFEDRGF